MQEMTRKQVVLFTGAECPKEMKGTGSWSCILTFGNHKKDLSGYQNGTTLERMELFSIISALGALKEPCDVRLYSNSSFLMETLRKKNLEKWMLSEWKDDNGEVLLHKDLFMILYFQTRKHHIVFARWNPNQFVEELSRCRELTRNALDEYNKMDNPQSDDQMQS